MVLGDDDDDVASVLYFCVMLSIASCKVKKKMQALDFGVNGGKAQSKQSESGMQMESCTAQATQKGRWNNAQL